MIGPAAPTAANAFVPTNLPTIIESAALYVSWKKLPSIKGIAKRIICGVILPTVMSAVFLFFIFYISIFAIKYDNYNKMNFSDRRL